MELIRDIWTQKDYADLVSYLYSVADDKYRDFNKKLIPDENDIIGIRIPVLRDIAKKISKGNIESFLKCIKGSTNEERILEGLVMASKRCDYEELLADMLRFASGIKNWAVCDTVKFKGASKYKEYLIEDIDLFLRSQNPWLQRYGFKMLMELYLEDEYIDFVLDRVIEVNSDFYYLQMMQGWLIATAAIKYADRVFALFKSGKLSTSVQNIAIQKMRESRRISDEDKIKASQYKRDNK